MAAVPGVSATHQMSSTPVEISLQWIDIADSQIDLTEDPPVNDDLHVV
jgi:hypothetical protein